MSCISLIVADSHPVVLRGLKSIFEAQDGFKVVACCTDGPHCIEAIRSLAPDVAILDITMSGLTGLETLAAANSEDLLTRLVFFAACIDERVLVTSAAAGAYGVIPKNVAPEILVESLRQVADGQKLLPLAFPEEVVPLVPVSTEIAENALGVLTNRERQIMSLVCEGLSNKEIGRRLKIAHGTIKVHLHNIFQKLEISNRTLLAALANANRGWDRIP